MTPLGQRARRIGSTSHTPQQGTENLDRERVDDLAIRERPAPQRIEQALEGCEVRRTEVVRKLVGQYEDACVPQLGPALLEQRERDALAHDRRMLREPLVMPPPRKHAGQLTAPASRGEPPAQVRDGIERGQRCRSERLRRGHTSTMPESP